MAYIEIKNWPRSWLIQDEGKSLLERFLMMMLNCAGGNQDPRQVFEKDGLPKLTRLNGEDIVGICYFRDKKLAKRTKEVLHGRDIREVVEKQGTKTVRDVLQVEVRLPEEMESLLTKMKEDFKVCAQQQLQFSEAPKSKEEFSVQVVRAENVRSWGFDAATCKDHLVVSRVRHGPLALWNFSNPDKKVLVGDVITSVNNFYGDGEGMANLLKVKSTRQASMEITRGYRSGECKSLPKLYAWGLPKDRKVTRELLHLSPDTTISCIEGGYLLEFKTHFEAREKKTAMQKALRDGVNVLCDGDVGETGYLLLVPETYYPSDVLNLCLQFSQVVEVRKIEARAFEVTLVPGESFEHLKSELMNMRDDDHMPGLRCLHEAEWSEEKRTRPRDKSTMVLAKNKKRRLEMPDNILRLMPAGLKMRRLDSVVPTSLRNNVAQYGGALASSSGVKRPAQVDAWEPTASAANEKGVKTSMKGLAKGGWVTSANQAWSSNAWWDESVQGGGWWGNSVAARRGIVARPEEVRVSTTWVGPKGGGWKGAKRGYEEDGWAKGKNKGNGKQGDGSDDEDMKGNGKGKKGKGKGADDDGSEEDWKGKGKGKKGKGKGEDDDGGSDGDRKGKGKGKKGKGKGEDDDGSDEDWKGKGKGKKGKRKGEDDDGSDEDSKGKGKGKKGKCANDAESADDDKGKETCEPPWDSKKPDRARNSVMTRW